MGHQKLSQMLSSLQCARRGDVWCHTACVEARGQLAAVCFTPAWRPQAWGHTSYPLSRLPSSQVIFDDVPRCHMVTVSPPPWGFLDFRGLYDHHSQQSDDPRDARSQFSTRLSSWCWLKLRESHPSCLSRFKHSKFGEGFSGDK